jgi:hypothetical protein
MLHDQFAIQAIGEDGTPLNLFPVGKRNNYTSG